MRIKIMTFSGSSRYPDTVSNLNIFYHPLHHRCMFSNNIILQKNEDSRKRKNKIKIGVWKKLMKKIK